MLSRRSHSDSFHGGSIKYNAHVGPVPYAVITTRVHGWQLYLPTFRSSLRRCPCSNKLRWTCWPEKQSNIPRRTDGRAWPYHRPLRPVVDTLVPRVLLRARPHAVGSIQEWIDVKVLIKDFYFLDTDSSLERRRFVKVGYGPRMPN